MRYNQKRRNNHWNNSTIFEHGQLNIKNASIFIIETEEKWARNIEDDIKKMQLKNFVSIIHAPIAKVSKSISHSQQMHWYDTQILDSLFVDMHAIDLILVDEPIYMNI